MIILITGLFEIYDRDGNPTGKKELLVSHGIDTLTDKTVIVSCEHPSKLGARFSMGYGEWIIDNEKT